MPVPLSISTVPRYITRLLYPVVLAALLASPAAHADPAALYTRLLPVAERGNPAAQYHVGMMLSNGIGTTKDPKHAFAWFEKGAAAGDLLASYKLGCYYAGQFVGVVALDAAKSFELKMAAANGGYSLAQVDVGLVFHRRGKFDEAIVWWTKAAEQGEPLALFNLARLYTLGTDVPQDRIKAYAYFKLAKLRSRQGTNARTDATFTET
jgi:tetratricopeptide (TPR) repeat protein